MMAISPSKKSITPTSSISQPAKPTQPDQELLAGFLVISSI
jgi:hypothetical protein